MSGGGSANMARGYSVGYDRRDAMDFRTVGRAMIRAAILFVGLAIWLAVPTQSVATQKTYNVDISASDEAGLLPDSPVHLLRIFGTVLFDLDLQDIVSSKLVLTHSGPQALGLVSKYPLTSRPTSSSGRGVLWHWQATPTELRRITDSDNRFGLYPYWDIHVGGGGHTNGASFYMGPFHPYIGFNFNPENVNLFDSHDVDLPGASGIGGDGYVFGTAVPEPSTFALTAYGLVAVFLAACKSRSR